MKRCLFVLVLLFIAPVLPAQDPTDQLRQMRENIEAERNRFDAVTKAQEHMWEAQSWAGLRETLRAASERGPAEKIASYAVLDATTGSYENVNFADQPEQASAVLQRAIAGADAQHEKHKAACLALLQTVNVSVADMQTASQQVWMERGGEQKMMDHYAVHVRAVDKKTITDESGVEGLAVQLAIMNRSATPITGLRGRLVFLNPDGSVLKEEAVDTSSPIAPGQIVNHPVMMEIEGEETPLLSRAKMEIQTQWVTEKVTFGGTRMVGTSNAKPIGISRPIHPMLP